MDIEDIEQFAKLTREEAEFIRIFRSLDKNEQNLLIEQINIFTYTDDE